MKILIALICCIFMSTTMFAQTTISGSFVSDGLTRTYRIYIPAIYNSSVAVPLVLNLHGYGSTNVEQELYTQFDVIADTANFILVYPNGTDDGTGNQFWNSFGFSPVDDLSFLSALIDTVSASYNIDYNAIYSTGMSNGGYMTYELACFLSNRIAAVASVAGTMTETHMANCTPSHPMPALHIHGTADAVVPYEGTVGSVAADTIVQHWVQFNNCNPTPTVTNVPNIVTTDGCTAQHYVYDSGDNGSTVEFYKVIGGGHSWPGAPININITNMDFNASLEIWRFFRKYKLNQLINSIAEQTELQNSFTIYPNPSQNNFTLNFNNASTKSITVTNYLGQLLQHIECSRNAVDIKLENSGLYFITVIHGDRIITEKVIKE